MWKVKGKKSKGEKPYIPVSVSEKAEEKCVKFPHHFIIKSKCCLPLCNQSVSLFLFCYDKYNTAQTAALNLISCTQNFGKSQWRLCGHQCEGFLTGSTSPTGKSWKSDYRWEMLDVIRGNVKKISSGFSPYTQWLFTHTTGFLINKTTTPHSTFIVGESVYLCVLVWV